MTMRYRSVLRVGATAFAAALLLTGCASGPPGRDVNDPTSSLVFGFVDMEEAPTDVEWVSLKQVATATDTEGYWRLGVEDGLAFNQYLPVGSYQMAKFGGSDFGSGEVEYNFPSYGKNETAVRITRPGVYFLGSYKYVKVKTGFFEAGKFDFKRVDAPAERELLERLLKSKEIKGTQWVARINARLAQLPAPKPAAPAKVKKK
jgi:hypothetical protein